MVYVLLLSARTPQSQGHRPATWDFPKRDGPLLSHAFLSATPRLGSELGATRLGAETLWDGVRGPPAAAEAVQRKWPSDCLCSEVSVGPLGAQARRGGVGGGGWEVEVGTCRASLFLPVPVRPSPPFSSPPGRMRELQGGGGTQRQPSPVSPQDLSTQLSRTGTLSRKSIKAPATPTSATLG